MISNIGFSESFVYKIGMLIPNGTPVTVTHTVTTVIPTTVTLSATPFTETPLTGTAVPVSTVMPATQTGIFIEAQMPPGSFFPLGIDKDPAGPAGAFFYAVGSGGPTLNRLGRVGMAVPG